MNSVLITFSRCWEWLLRFDKMWVSKTTQQLGSMWLCNGYRREQTHFTDPLTFSATSRSVCARPCPEQLQDRVARAGYIDVGALKCSHYSGVAFLIHD